ncbi:MAG: cytochrome c oxidase subunit I [Thermomicrobiales bacterium]
MASIAQPRARTMARPTVKANTGLWSWITTVDHKRLGLMYGVSAFFFFLLGGLEALVIRAQLVRPDNDVVGAARYNELFTMHGTTMIFLAVMPLSVAFFNYIMPLQIGARDVAFPRMNAFSFWLFIAGAVMLNVSWFFNEAPNQGWYGYSPLTDKAWNPTHAVDFWVLGLQILGVSSMLGAFNFIVTVLNMRAPGVTLMRMPIFSWTTFVVSIMIIMAFPAITVALILLMMDRFVGTGFFATAAGGDPLLWQHLFWVFGHPEVYILVLPAFGIISEIIPTFSRKPLFGYAVMVYATCAIAFLGFAVWAHHMFTTGLGPTANSVFAATTMIIAIPTGVKIFNWIGTMWLGQLKFTTPMLFAVGLVSQFTIGGLSGVMHASPPIDSQHNDSYFVIAHFHYVLFGGAVFGLLAAIIYWFPKFTGRLLNDSIGRVNFWLVFVGFNATFFPMHFLGLEGMPRRYYSYGEGSGWWFWNAVVSFGALVLGASILLFLYNIAYSLKRGQVAGPNPWDASTLEWATSSPPPVYNFAVIPHISQRDPLWAEKYGIHTEDSEVDITLAGREIGEIEAPDEDEHDQMRRRLATDDTEPLHIHMPNPSWYPIVGAIGMFLMMFGLITDKAVLFQLGPLDMTVMTIVGLLMLLFSIFGWSFEPAE